MAWVSLPGTLVTAGGAALINAWLAWRVGLVRRAAAVSIGDGGNLALATRMRAQANFVENAPFIVILIGLIEFAQGSSIWLWVVSAIFLIVRVAHARSEEHTSELQSLMRISYAVFCLKKKTQSTQHPT